MTRLWWVRVAVLILATVSLPAQLVQGQATTETAQYVAMGDSFSSGTGAPAYDDGTEKGCRRGPTAFPRVLADRLGHRLALAHVACHGAKTTDLADQMGGLGDSVDLVTITIGGNDVGFSSLLKRCVFDTLFFPCSDKQREFDAGLDDLGKTLERTYEEIVEKAENAYVLVVGYPNILSSKSRKGLLGPPPSHLRWFQDAAIDLDGVIRGAVGDVRAEGHTIRYVSTLDVFQGHEACTDDEQVFCIKRNPGRGILNESFHPNARGHQALADKLHPIIEASLGGDRAAGTTATELIVDISSSMKDAFDGKTKIDWAISSALRVAKLIGNDASATKIPHRLGLVSFSSGAAVQATLGEDIVAVQSAISSLSPFGDTNIGAGIRRALNDMEGASEPVRSLILLSDGQVTRGLAGFDLLNGPVAEAAAQGVQIFTIGFGDQGEIDEQLLQDIAAETGGSYGFADSPWELDRYFIRARVQSSGDLVGDFEGAVGQGQSVTAGTAALQDGLGQLQAVLSWPGSDLDLHLKDPDGQVVDASYPGASIFRHENPEYIIVADPIPGDWAFEVRGVETQGPEDFMLLASTRKAKVRAAIPAAGGPAVLVILMVGLAVMVGAGGGTALLVSGKAKATCPVCGQRSRPADATCKRCRYPLRGGLIAITTDAGSGTRRRLLLAHGDTVGRDSGVTHEFSDPMMSRRHARITWESGDWIISDLDSSAGVYRNAEQVLQAGLHPGDLIRLGDVELRIEGIKR